MAKRNRDSSELNMDSLMDAVTNVVGVLMIVFVMMALNLANSVAKILSELPPVTEEQHKQMQQQLAQTPPPAETPEEIEEKQKQAQQDLQKAIEELRSIDVADMASIQFMDLDEFRKKLEDARKKRDGEKVEVEKLLTEVERLKALLDETPEYKPEAATIVRLPNPRPYPAEPNETRILIAKEGALFFNQNEFMAPIMDGLSKMTNQLTYREVKPEPFVKVLTDVLGSADNARKAWEDVSPLVGSFQMEEIALAWKALTEASLPANKDVLTQLGDISLALRNQLGAVGEAVAALTKGDLIKWVGLDPSKDPTKPTLKAEVKGASLAMTYGNKTDDVKSNPRDIMAYIKDLAGRDGIKNRSRSVTIYDAYKIEDALKRAASAPGMSKVFQFAPEIRPGQTLVYLKLTPSPGGGESLEQMKRPESNYQRMLRQIAADPNGVALFQVMPDAFASYLEARLIADESRVAATWETLSGLEISIPVRGYDVQRFQKAPQRRPNQPNLIRGPKRSLD